MNRDKSPKYSRSEMLLGEEAISLLADTRVAIFGIGGVGGYAFEALVRSGIGEIDVIDADTVSESNINRQLLAKESTVGENKTELARKRAAEISPEIKVNAINLFYDEQNADSFNLRQYDYIIDAIDTVSSKCTLIERASKAGVPIISSMGTGGKLDPTMLKVADIYKTSVCPLARTVRAELRKRGVKKLKVVYSEEEPIKNTVIDTHGGKTVHRAPGSMIFVPATAGLILAKEAVLDLIKIKSKTNAENTNKVDS